MTKILDIKNLNFKYGKTTIFKDFNLSVDEGEFVAIIGANASGKTTLIKLIAGILPSNNTIAIGYSYVNNNRIYDHSKEYGLVFGNVLNSFLFDDVYKEMAFPLENLNIEPKNIEKRILEIASLFGINKLLDMKIKDLTKSQKQQLLLAISLLHEPKILLLDNPFSMMDKNTKSKIKNTLKTYQTQNNLTIILTTSNLEDTIDSDYLYIINKGEIVVEGEPLIVLKEDTILNRLGLQLPFMADLSNKLNFYQLIDNIELDMKGLVDTLWK